MQIVVRQISGLGNQLFQYAAGRFYANQFAAHLRLAIDPPKKAFSHGNPRPFLLSNLSITAPCAELTEREHLLLATRPALQPIARVLQRLAHTEVLREPLAQRYTFPPVPTPRLDTQNIYLVGYWQSHRMVDLISNDLRREFAFRLPPQGKDREILAQIASCAEPVSLHIRRGDYTLAAEGRIALPLDFYTRAIALFRQRLADPTFFIFSDDIPFARENLPRDLRAIFVDHNDDASSHQDMRLMSACHHHIIANSSFSWWGAWLNPRPGKLVYAPRYWLLTRRSFFPGLFAPDWIIGDFEPRD